MDEEQLSETKLATDHLDLRQQRVYCTTLPTVCPMINVIAVGQYEILRTY